MGHWKIPPKTVTKKSNRDISKRVKFIAAAYTAPKENRAECKCQETIGTMWDRNSWVTITWGKI